MKKAFIVLLMIGYTNLVFSEEKEAAFVPKGLRKLENIEIGSSEWYTLNYSDYRYQVFPDGNFRKVRGNGKDKIELRTEHGILTGSDNGEWGGRLDFQSGQGASAVVLKGNIRCLFEFGNDVVVLAGLAHLGFNDGKLIRLYFRDGTYVVSDELSLSGAPAAYWPIENGILIVTFDGLDQFTEGKVRNILKNQIWESLFPYSLVKIGSSIVIGARGCIIVVDRNLSVSVYS